MTASKQMPLSAVAAAIAAVVFFLPALASATDYVVGDSAGWTLGVDYTAWAQSKEFRVGDTLSFKYSKGSHDVVELSGADFKACNTGGATTASVWSSGEDIVTLDQPGRRWFVCAVGEHCQHGMKLVVNVLPGTLGPVPAPEPTPGDLHYSRGFPGTLGAVPAPEPAAADLHYSRRFLSRWW